MIHLTRIIPRLKPFLWVVLMVLLCPSWAAAWDQTLHENILVFDETGQPVAGYHTGNWSTKVDTSGLVRFELWTQGSPPALSGPGTDAITLEAGQVAVPNYTPGSSVAPSSGVPAVSLYSFDASVFPSTAPGKVPGISITPTPGSYTHTLAVELTAYALEGDPVVQIKNAAGTWEDRGNPCVIYISRDRVIQARASNDGNYSDEKTYSYTVSQPALVDSDSDGIPDVWEIQFGFNPLSSKENPLDVDTDLDGVSDFDEILRGTDPKNNGSVPVDRDLDGWSDLDETLRGTSPTTRRDTPTATRLYEIETKTSGTFLDHEGSSLALAVFEVETVNGEERAQGQADDSGNYSCRIPRGTETVIRVVSNLNSAYTMKRFFPDMADLTPADMVFTEEDCTGGDPSLYWQEWQSAWWAYLGEHLVVTEKYVPVDPSFTVVVGLLERQLEILTGAVPEEVLYSLPEGTPEEFWLSFALFGHRPAPSVVEALKTMIASPRTLAFDEDRIQPPRTLSNLVEDIETLMAQPCQTLASQAASLYEDTSSGDLMDDRMSRLLQGSEGTYLSGLLMAYAMDAVTGYSVNLCHVLDPLEDSDQDGIANGMETATALLPHGVSDPFALDTDTDGITDDQDNCTLVYNPDQLDRDQDGAGDLCDSDDDNDGLDDEIETAFGSNPYDDDTDDDGEKDLAEWQAASDPGIAVYLTHFTSPSNQTGQTVTGFREENATVLLAITGGATLGTVLYPTPTTFSCALSDMTGEGSYTLSLTGSDGTGREGISTQEIQVDLTAPVVDITSPEDGSVLDLNTPLLVFSASEGSVLVRVDEETVSIDSGEALSALTEGDHLIRITAVDGAGNTGFDEITFTVDANRPPLAHAGPDQTVAPDAPVSLSGVNTIDLDNGITGFAWQQTAGETVTLTGSDTSLAAFTAPLTQGAMAFELTVTDESGETATARCLVNVSDDNLPPTADAGDDMTVLPATVIQLDGSASLDPEAQNLTFSWQQAAGPGVVLSDTSLASPEFTAPSPADDGASLIFELTVTDGEGLMARDQVVVSVKGTNTAPLANAGPDQEVDPGQVVILSGSQSQDSDGTLETSQWQDISGNPVTLDGPGALTTTFTAPETASLFTTLRLRLTVTDNAGLLDQDELDITIVRMDQDDDLDVDGKDLFWLIQQPGLSRDSIKAFAERFGL